VGQFFAPLTISAMGMPNTRQMGSLHSPQLIFGNSLSIYIHFGWAMDSKQGVRLSLFSQACKKFKFFIAFFCHLKAYFEKNL